MVTLDSSRLFRQLPREEAAALTAAAEVRPVSAGTAIFREGDPGDGVYVIQEGRVRIVARLRDEERVFAVLGPGDFFGEMTLLDHQPRSAAAIAEGVVSVWFVPRAAMLSLMHRSPELALALAREISVRLREFNHHYLREMLQAEKLAVVGRLTSSIVHDLKNPLTIINMAGDLVASEHVTREGRLFAQERIQAQVERITNLVNDILDFVKGGGEPPARTPTDYAQFVTALVEDLRKEAELRQATIEFETPPPSVILPLNPRRLNRVFYNLVNNAFDAMPDGGSIRLRFSYSDRSVMTEIEDSGRGIAPEIIERLFQPFVTHGKDHGTGLGLSIVKRIVEEYGGTIAVRNRAGGGAIFSFSLSRQP